jgi:ferric-dicitrate binding protein FerR (iron transport regulator)
VSTATAVSLVLLAALAVWLALVIGATWIQLQDDIDTAAGRREGSQTR